MEDFLLDKNFLLELDNLKIREHYVRIVILDFFEKPLKEIQGTVSNGTLTVNGNSAVRRTINLTMIATEEENDITNLDYLISINKKVKIFIGLKNPFTQYAHYGDIVWFKCGVFILSSANINRGTNGITISINGQDKMTKLNGVIGGALPASVSFHERYEYTKDGELFITNPTIYQIIFEAVNHFGEEPVNNIFINDLDETVKLMVRYEGDSPIRFSNDYNSFIISDTVQAGYEKNKYIAGQDVGYMETPFTYPGELILGAGETVASLLDRICKTLTNYEYFYDIDGRFIFQEKKNYLNHSYTPITELNNSYYLKSFSDSKYAYTFTNNESITSLAKSPKYDNIKNDFICWGTRKGIGDAEIGIRYHLAVDEKPQIDLAQYYMWKESYESDTGELIINYVYTPKEEPPKSNYEIELIAKPSQEWREELYRQALEVDAVSGEPKYYDEELLAEWRNLYDTMNTEWEKEWNDYYNYGITSSNENYNPWTGWNPKVFNDPASLNYWLDFIDDGSKIGEYSVNKIGRRTKVLNNKDSTILYRIEPPDIIFFENPENIEELNEKIETFNSIGQKFCILNSNQMELFSTSTTGISAFETLRETVYQNLSYNASVTINCIPRYYLEPNILVYIDDKKSGIKGDFVIQQFSVPLGYGGTMSISATENLTRI